MDRGQHGVLRQKERALGRVAGYLHCGGTSIIDMPPPIDQIVRTTGFENEGAFLHIQVPESNATLHYHFCDESSVVEMAARAGLIHQKTVQYLTDSTPASVRRLLFFESIPPLFRPSSFR